MLLSRAVKEMRAILKQHGDMEFTCTGSTKPDGYEVPRPWSSMHADVFETTVENFIVTLDHPKHGKAVRAWL